VQAVVLAIVEQAMAPIRQRLDELEERSVYLVRLIAAGAAAAPTPSRPETQPLSADFRRARSRRAIALVGCVVALVLAGLFGLAQFWR
jgi:hypothetical protein